MSQESGTKDVSASLAFLGRIAWLANDATDLEETLAAALGEMCRYMGWPVGHAYLADRAGLSPTRVWHLHDEERYGPFRRASAEVTFRPGEGLVGRALVAREPMWVQDVKEEPWFVRADAAEAAGLRAAFVFPVLVRDEVAAVLEFYGTEPAAPGDALLEPMVIASTEVGRMIERDRAASRVRQSEDRFRLLFESAMDAVFLSDLEGRITRVNSAAERLSGYSEAELWGKTIFDLVAPEWNDVTRRSVDAKVAGEIEANRYESVLVDRGGRRVAVEVSSTVVRDGDEMVGMQAFVRDIGERQRAERALRESEERFRQAFDLAPIGMALVALPSGRWLRVNDALCELVGYSQRELLELTLREITQPDDLEADLAQMERMLAGEIDRYETERRYVRKDGAPVRVLLSASLVRGADGEPAYGIAQIQDLTPRPAAVPEPQGALTPREREVLGLLAEGSTSADAARRLSISEETVQTHVRRAMGKLRARSRTQAVAAALRLGLLPEAA